MLLYSIQKGLTCDKRGDFLEAIENFTQALKLDLNNAYLYYRRGLAKKEAEFPKEAIWKE